MGWLGGGWKIEGGFLTARTSFGMKCFFLW